MLIIWSESGPFDYLFDVFFVVQYAMAVDSDETGVVYELVGVVSLITDARLPDKNNLVATIKVGTSYHEQSGASSVDHWYLFNDIRQGMDKRIIHEFPGKTLRHIKIRLLYWQIRRQSLDSVFNWLTCFRC